MNLIKKIIYGGMILLGSYGLFSCSEEPTPTPKENNPVVIISKPLEKIVEGESGSFQVNTENKDGNSLEYSLTGNPDWLSINSETGLVRWKEQRVDEDSFYDNIELKVLDKEDSDSAIQNWNITIEDTVKYFSVSSGESIQDVIDSVDEDDGFKHIIEVASGLYNENLNINKNISLIGAGSNVTNIFPSVDLPLITISSSGTKDYNLLIKGFNLQTDNSAGATQDGKMTAIMIGDEDDVSYVRLEDIIGKGNNHVYPGLESGISINPNISVYNLTIVNSDFRDFSYGFISGAITSTNPGNLENLIIRNSTFSNNSTKGIYTERLSNGLFENLTIENNGNVDLSASWADDWNAGIDINLKYGDYQNIVLRNIETTGNGIGSINGAGLTIKARGTGNDHSGSPDWYDEHPATLDNVLIDRGNYTGNNSYDIRFGEVGKGNTSPTNINLMNVNYGTLSNELDGVTIIDNKIFCMP